MAWDAVPEPIEEYTDPDCFVENGHYMTSSGYLGYGERQDDDLLHNCTVAKTSMDCDFEFESPLYQCVEIEMGLRVALLLSHIIADRSSIIADRSSI